ncbi:iron(3+)-hydroxamate import ATP-binding protein FhuC [Abditibacteriota bacterium]|nr:iron(3+)-hydroxamate import ATP-binding protein FhuC [Abditibacteriota bacterium]
MLELRSLSVQLGARRVLQEVSLSVAPGQLCAVLGPNGSGKSTLLRSLVGLVAPTGGEMLWKGRPLPADKRARARLVSFLPQGFGGGNEMTVEEMAMLGRTPHLPPYGTPTATDRDAVEAAITRAAPDLRGRKLGQLSGGQRQRALLPRVLATEAPILLLDEPVSALDVRYQHEILGLARQVTREENLVTLVSLHGLNLAALVADSMLLLDSSGSVAARGSVADVMRAEILERVYEMPMRVSPHPESGIPQAQSLWKFEE